MADVSGEHRGESRYLGAEERWLLGESQATPYRGADFYGREHAHLFFGRQKDGNELACLALSHRLSLLHAASGAGKTSLLHAHLMPDLEDRGWIAVRALPQTHPQRALKVATLASMLPELGLELHAIDRTTAAVAPLAGGADLTLLELKRLVRDIPRSSTAFVTLLSPYQPAIRDGAPCTPFFVRFLELSNGPQLLARHLFALDALSGARYWNAATVEDLTDALARVQVRELRHFFERQEPRHVRAELMRFFDEPGLPLDACYVRIQKLWGSHFRDFRLLLILDQFEELFTRYVDQKLIASAHDNGLPHYQRRVEYFQELGCLLGAARSSSGLDADSSPALHVLISMRDEHIARLDELEADTGPLGIARYHLGRLNVAEAAAVIRRPAQIFEYDYDEEVFAEIKTSLPTEGSIEPGHVQIVCERLWNEAGRALVAAHAVPGASPANGARAVISHDVFKGLGAVTGIFADHFGRVLASYEDPLDRFEILDLLEPLIAFGSRRNIVPTELLTNSLFRQKALRQALLETLRQKRIVRIEWRLGGEFAELTHEFLISPINVATAKGLRENPEWQLISSGLRSLLKLAQAQEGFRLTNYTLLTAGEVSALLCYHDRLDLGAHSWIPEVVYRSAIMNGQMDGTLTRACALLSRPQPPIDVGSLLADLPRRDKTRYWFDRRELEALSGCALTDVQRAFALRSVLCLSSSDSERLITLWFGRPS